MSPLPPMSSDAPPLASVASPVVVWPLPLPIHSSPERTPSSATFPLATESLPLVLAVPVCRTKLPPFEPTTSPLRIVTLPAMVSSPKPLEPAAISTLPAWPSIEPPDSRTMLPERSPSPLLRPVRILINPVAGTASLSFVDDSRIPPVSTTTEPDVPGWSAFTVPARIATRPPEADPDSTEDCPPCIVIPLPRALRAPARTSIDPASGPDT